VKNITSPQLLLPEVGTRVFVYYNLHKKVWSVRAMEGHNKGRVVLHTTTLALDDCVMRVSEASRQRVLRERSKNVHAGIIGTLLPFATGRAPGDVHVTYYPYLYATFVLACSKEPVFSASHVFFDKYQVWATLN
jgi:hypothetical protein